MSESDSATLDLSSWISWNEWISLPNKFSSIPPDAQLTFTVWDVVGAGKAVPIGGATLKLFDNG
jgi:phosphatidylinositol 3-kinase